MQVKVEVIYRVVKTYEVNEASFGNEYLEVDDDTQMTTLKRGQLGLEMLMKTAEEEVYTDVFDDAIQNNGPDGWFFKGVLLDDDGVLIEDRIHDETDSDNVRVTI